MGKMNNFLGSLELARPMPLGAWAGASTQKAAGGEGGVSSLRQKKLGRIIPDPATPGLCVLLHTLLLPQLLPQYPALRVERKTQFPPNASVSSREVGSNVNPESVQSGFKRQPSVHGGPEKGTCSPSPCFLVSCLRGLFPRSEELTHIQC